MRPIDLDAIPLAAFLLAPDGRVLEANRLCLEMLRADDSLRGLAVAALLPDDDRAHDRLQAAAGSGRPLRVHARRRNGVPVSIDAFTSVLDDRGVLLCALREVRDAQLLEESQQWLGVAFETAPVGMALFDTDGCYVRVNPALCRMLKRSPAELLGRRDQELTHPADRQRDVEAAWRILNGETDTWQTEKRFLAADGSIVWAIANLTFLRDDVGRPLAWLGQFQDITIRKSQEERLRHLADHDELTGVANRRRLLREVGDRLRQAQRYGDHGAVILIDLDGFKAVNDTQGHDAGDRALVTVARAMGQRLRSTDLLGRLGGDEFAVLLPHADAAEAQTVSAALQDAVRRATDGRLSASCGVAVFGTDGQVCPERLLAAADRAMYAAKAARRADAVPAGPPGRLPAAAGAA